MALLILLAPVRTFDTISLILLLDAVVEASGSLSRIPSAPLWPQLWLGWNIPCPLSLPLQCPQHPAPLSCLRAFSEAALTHRSLRQAQQMHPEGSPPPVRAGGWNMLASCSSAAAQFETFHTILPRIPAALSPWWLKTPFVATSFVLLSFLTPSPVPESTSQRNYPQMS